MNSPLEIGIIHCKGEGLFNRDEGGRREALERAVPELGTFLQQKII
jgi:hypothetical protein